MADKKTSQEPAASELDGTELVRIVQDGVNKKATVSQFKNPITVDFLTLSQLTVDHAVIEGQVYKYVDATFLPASIDHILLTGSGTQTYNNIGQAYVTAIGKYVQCDYDLASNKIYAQLTNKMFVSTDGFGGITIDSVVNNEWNGITFSASNVSGGTYLLVPSQTLQTIFTAVSMHCEQVTHQGSDVAGFASLVDDYAHDEYYYYIYDTTFSSSGAITFPHNLITFIGYIYN